MPVTYSPARAGAGLDNGIVTVATDSADRGPVQQLRLVRRPVGTGHPGAVPPGNGGGTTTLSGTSMP